MNMDAKWKTTQDVPTVNKYGVSNQLILLTNVGNFNTGYFNNNNMKWEVEGLLQHKEFPVAWLDGVTRDLC